MNFHFHRIWSLRFTTTGNDLSILLPRLQLFLKLTTSLPNTVVEHNHCITTNPFRRNELKLVRLRQYGKYIGLPPTFIYFLYNRMQNSWLKPLNATKKGEVSNGLHPRLPPGNEPARCLWDREMAAYDSEFSTNCRNCLLLTSRGDMNKRKLIGIAQLRVSMLHLSDKLSNKLIRFVEGKTLMKQFTTSSWYLLSDSNVIL